MIVQKLLTRAYKRQLSSKRSLMGKRRQEKEKAQVLKRKERGGEKGGEKLALKGGTKECK